MFVNNGFAPMPDGRQHQTTEDVSVALYELYRGLRIIFETPLNAEFSRNQAIARTECLLAKYKALDWHPDRDYKELLAIPFITK